MAYLGETADLGETAGCAKELNACFQCTVKRLRALRDLTVVLPNTPLTEMDDVTEVCPAMDCVENYKGEYKKQTDQGKTREETGEPPWKCIKGKHKKQTDQGKTREETGEPPWKCIKGKHKKLADRGKTRGETGEPPWKCIKGLMNGGGWVTLLLALLFAVSINPAKSGVPEQTISIKSASLEMSPDPVWQGESTFMRCVAKPKDVCMTTVLWARLENDGTYSYFDLYDPKHPKTTVPNKQFAGRISGWLDVEEGTYNVNITRTLVSDTADYICLIADDNYVDKVSPKRQLTVNVKHFNHGIRVNESSESFSRCEEVTVDNSSEDEEVKITCSVTSAPKSLLRWSVISSHDKDKALGQSVDNCTAHSTHTYTCTSTTSLKLRALTSKRTQIHCEAKYQTLTPTSDACVTLVYENYSPPTPSVHEQTVSIKSASLELTSDTVCQGESTLMRCVARPKYAGISKVLWMRREHDGTMEPIYLHDQECPKAIGPYKQFTGRISGWLNVDEGTCHLNLTKTIMSDTAEYYCIVTDDNHLDTISPAKQLTVSAPVDLPHLGLGLGVVFPLLFGVAVFVYYWKLGKKAETEPSREERGELESLREADQNKEVESANEEVETAAENNREEQPMNSDPIDPDINTL